MERSIFENDPLGEMPASLDYCVGALLAETLVKFNWMHFSAAWPVEYRQFRDILRHALADPYKYYEDLTLFVGGWKCFKPLLFDLLEVGCDPGFWDWPCCGEDIYAWQFNFDLLRSLLVDASIFSDE